MSWVWTDVFSHPLWAVSTVILGLLLRSQQRGSWDPRACLVQLKGKTAIVTGANTGIGKFIALDFARRGARVIMACRNEARGTAALQEIRKRSGNTNVHLRLVDTSSLASVRAFVEGVLREEKELHILVNNAGASGLPGDITSDGLEVSFATNHVGPFLLTNLLLDLLKRSAPARIVNVSSVNHWRGVVDFSHFKGENLAYTMDSVYNHTKLHNSSEEGAVSTIYCAVAEETEGITGKYFDSDCSLVLPAPLARDPALAVKDFEFCERLTSKL
ncbi:unnamed protein product [Coregonus sp. 'balchen']|nr:unnamed protein product [Coregonus sp. 'balchen']